MRRTRSRLGPHINECGIRCIYQSLRYAAAEPGDRVCGEGWQIRLGRDDSSKGVVMRVRLRRVETGNVVDAMRFVKLAEITVLVVRLAERTPVIL